MRSIARMTALLLLVHAVPAWAKTESTIYTPEKVQSARDNIARYDWAKSARDTVVAYAAKWVAMSDEQMWNLPVEQTVPRTIYVNQHLGCPIHGRQIIDKYGAYGGWKVDPVNKPWKVQCPIGGETWPTNDYARFYASGKDANNVFQFSRANRSLLYSVDSTRNYGVDDGTGYVDGSGNRYNFIAYYVHWGVWQNVGRSWSQALVNLGEAYAMTGNQAYAHKAAILLSRIADLLPSMDTNYWSSRGYPQGDGTSGRGLVLGSIWDAKTASAVARAWDAVWPGIQNDPALYTFLQGKANQYGLSTVNSPSALAAHIRIRALVPMLQAVQQRRIRANEGVHQSAYAEMALALDDATATPQWLDWLLQPGTVYDGGGHLPSVLVDWVDRDGGTDEASPGYTWVWLEAIQPLADLIEDSPYAEKFSLTKYPNFRPFLSFPFWLQIQPTYYPHIGDDGATGNPGLAPGTDAGRYAAAFHRYGYPELARMAYTLNGNKADGLHGSVWDPGADETAAAIAAVVQKEGVIERGPLLLPGYGLHALTTTTENREPAAVWLYSGRMAKHGHWDRLNLGLYGYGLDLAPDLGYPDYPTVDSPNYWGFQNNTVSHNTVVVDAKRQKAVRAGMTQAFLADTPVKVMEVDGNGVYDAAQTYRRTVLQVPTDRGFYVVDLFRVKGGSDHLYSFHAGPGGVTPQNLKLVLQTGGTYAGPSVPFGSFYDGTCCTSYTGSGFQFFDNVYRDTAPPESFALEWAVQDNWGANAAGRDVRLKVWSAGDRASNVAIARAYPPANIPGNPTSLRYLLERRVGAAPLTSTFVHVLDPYEASAQVAGVERFTPVPSTDAQGFPRVGLRVRLTDGRVDTIIHSLEAGTTTVAPTADGAQPAFEADGRFTVVASRDGTIEWAHVAGGAGLRADGQGDVRNSPPWRGNILAIDSSRSNDVRLDVSPPPPAGRWTGRWLRVARPDGHNPIYRIQSVYATAETATVLLGRVNPVRGHKVLTDYAQGTAADIVAGDAYEVLADAWGKPGSFVPEADDVRYPDGEGPVADGGGDSGSTGGESVVSARVGSTRRSTSCATAPTAGLAPLAASLVWMGMRRRRRGGARQA